MKLHSLLESANLTPEQIVQQIKTEGIPLPLKKGDEIYLLPDQGFDNQWGIANTTQGWAGLVHIEDNTVVEIEETDDDAETFLRKNPSIRKEGYRLQV